MSTYQQEDQVFIADEEEIKASEAYLALLSSNQQKTTENKSTEEVKSIDHKKKFIADNGIPYIWDDEEDCWVVDEDPTHPDDDDYNNDNNNDEGDSDDDMDEILNTKNDGTVNTSSNIDTSKKRKRNKKKKPKKVVLNWIYVTGSDRYL